MKSATVDNLFERVSFRPLSIPKSRRPIYQSRRHGREDGRLGADLTSSYLQAAPMGGSFFILVPRSAAALSPQPELHHMRLWLRQ